MDVTDPRTSTQGEPRNFPRRPGLLGVPYFGSPHRPFPPVLRRLGDGQQSPLELRSGSILPCGRVEFTCHFTEPMTCKGVLQRRFFFWLSLLEMTEGQRSFSVARACLVSGGVQAELGQHVGSTWAARGSPACSLRERICEVLVVDSLPTHLAPSRLRFI